MYLELEQFRFQDKIKIDFQFDKNLSLEELYIPPLLIQPIIENAFKHGLMHKEENGRLVARIKTHDENHIQCIIEDNGVGRAKAKELSKWKKHRSSGLKTTQERLNMISGKEETNLKIIDLKDENDMGIGTRVELMIKVNSKF